jgi:hypothetical protein
MAAVWKYTDEASGDQVTVVVLEDGAAVVEIPVHVLKARMTGDVAARQKVGTRPVVVRVPPGCADTLGRILRGEQL